MTSQVTKAILVLTVLALGSIQMASKEKEANCPTMGHLVQQSKATVTEILPVLSFLGEFYTLVDEKHNHFNTPTERESFVKSFSEGRKNLSKFKGHEIFFVLEHHKFTEEAVKKMTKTQAHKLVHDMFINSKVSKVEIVNSVS